jgi:hypothetical protein
VTTSKSSQALIIFLPADDTETSRSLVSRVRWIYWSITIPLTVLLLVLWRVWCNSKREEMLKGNGEGGNIWDDVVAWLIPGKHVDGAEDGSPKFMRLFLDSIVPVFHFLGDPIDQFWALAWKLGSRQNSPGCLLCGMTLHKFSEGSSNSALWSANLFSIRSFSKS